MVIFLLLLFLSVCSAQNGISPDTVLTYANGFGYYSGPLIAIYYADEAPGVTSAFSGNNTATEGCTLFFSDTSAIGNIISAEANFRNGKYHFNRGFVCFNTIGLPEPDTCKLFLNTDGSVTTGDGDSLWTVEFDIRCQDECSLGGFECLTDKCNFYRCQEKTFKPNTAIDNYHILNGEIDINWVEIPVSTTLFNRTDTTIIGLVTRRNPVPSPTSSNYIDTEQYEIVGDSLAMLVYWFTEDTSGQDGGDSAQYLDHWGLDRYALKPWGNRRW